MEAAKNDKKDSLMVCHVNGGLVNNQETRKMCPVMTATALSNDAGSQHVYT